MTKKSWDSDRSSAFHQEEEKKEEIVGPEIDCAGGSFDPLLALSYSSSAAPVKNDGGSSTPPVTLDDESTAPPIDEDSSAAPVSSDDEPLTMDDESTKEPADDAEEDSMLGSGFGPSLDARLRELDEASDKPTKDYDDEEPQDETTDDIEEEDTEENIDSAVVDAISLKSSSSRSKVASLQSSKDQESVTSTEENESPEEPSDPSWEDGEGEGVLEGPLEEPTEEIEQEKASRRLKPPLFPGRSRPPKRSLREKLSPGIASYLRSRSTPPSKTDKLNKNVVERATSSLDGRVENARDSTSMNGSATGDGIARSRVAGVSVTARSDAGSTAASVQSCSDKSVEVVAVNSIVTSAPEPDPVESLHQKQNLLPPATAKPKISESTESVTKDASSEGEVFAKTMHETMDRISTEMSPASNEIQDPWPNPWAEDAGTIALEALDQVHNAPGLAKNPHIVSKEAPTDSVLENVVGVVLSSGVSAASVSMEAKDGIESYVALDTTDLISVDNIPTYPATLNPNLVVASLAEEARTNAPFEGDQTVEDIDRSSHRGRESCAGHESEPGRSETEKMESPGPVKDWKELLASEESSAAGLSVKAIGNKEEEQGENTGEVRRQSSLWKRTKRIVKTRRNSHKNLYQAGVEANSGKVAASTKKQKFKLAYLCLFSPCGSKRLASIEEGGGEHDNLLISCAKAEFEAKANPVATPVVVTQEIESLAEEATDEMDQAFDDLVEGLNDTESGEVQSPDNNPIQPAQGANDSVAQVALPQGTLNSCKAKARKPSRAKESKVDSAEIEETKSDLVQLDLASSKQNSRSWITDLPSVESLMGQGPQKTFSDFSSIGDVSGGADGPNGPNMISSINYYVAVASKAMQENLYDRPVRELERLRDLSCAGAEEQSSLASMSNDSAQANRRTTTAKGAKKSADFFSIAFGELVDVLECTPLANSPRKKTRLSPPNKKFEEQKIEMFGSTSGGE